MSYCMYTRFWKQQQQQPDLSNNFFKFILHLGNSKANSKYFIASNSNHHNYKIVRFILFSNNSTSHQVQEGAHQI